MDGWRGRGRTSAVCTGTLEGLAGKTGALGCQCAWTWGYGALSVPFSRSIVSASVTSWTAAHQVSLSRTISRTLLKLTSIESMMPSTHLILCHPLLLLPSVFPSIRIFSSESALHIRWPKYWSFSLSISPSNEYSWLILDFPGGSDGKASAYNAGDPGSIPASGRSPGERKGNPLQYSCLEATVLCSKFRTGLVSFFFHILVYPLPCLA